MRIAAPRYVCQKCTATFVLIVFKLKKNMVALRFASLCCCFISILWWLVLLPLSFTEAGETVVRERRSYHISSILRHRQRRRLLLLEGTANYEFSDNEHKEEELFHKLIEGDMVPVYQQVLETYGRNTTKRFVQDGYFTSMDLEEMNVGDNDNLERRHNYYLWPSDEQARNQPEGRVEIGYDFDKDSSFMSSKEDREILETALQTLADGSGVLKFVYSTTKVPRIRFTQTIQHDYDEPFWSYVGYHGMDIQPLFLSSDVLKLFPIGSVHHEMLHALGFWHTNSRYDRDSFVDINWTNVPAEYRLYFLKRQIDDTLGYPYDYYSVMHYTKNDYSPDGVTIIKPTSDNATSAVSEDDLGAYDIGASIGDLIQLRLLYQCKSGPRSYSEYLLEKCTTDCQYWENIGPCHGNDDACQGNLICNSSIINGNDQCVQPLQGEITRAETTAATTVVNTKSLNSFVLVVVAVVLLTTVVASIICIHYRNKDNTNNNVTKRHEYITIP